MKTRMEPSSSYLARRAGRLARILCTLSPALFAATVTADPDPDAAMATDQRVALNQGASLDETPAIPVKAAEKTAEASAKPMESSKTASAAGASPASRTIRRSSAERGRTTPIAPQGSRLPWYRTGFGALAIVLVLVGGAAWAFRRWMPTSRLGDSDILRVVGRTSLTPKHTVALVHVGRRFVMVGVCGDRLETLSEVSDPDEVADLLARVAQPVTKRSGDGFDRLLVSEADRYDQVLTERPAEQADDDVQRPGRKGSAAGDLLRKLRALQTP